MRMRARTGIRIALLSIILSSSLWTLANLPNAKFIENKCQWNDEIQFLAHVPGGSMQLLPGGFSYTFIDQQRMEELHDFGHRNEKESAR